MLSRPQKSGFRGREVSSMKQLSTSFGLGGLNRSISGFSAGAGGLRPPAKGLNTSELPLKGESARGAVLLVSWINEMLTIWSHSVGHAEPQVPCQGAVANAL